MGDRWGAEGPPEEAYSRHDRDLAAVSAGFARYLDGLPDRLTATYDCVVRDATPGELVRLQARYAGGLDKTYVAEPGGEGRSPLSVGRGTFQGGTIVVLGLGRSVVLALPGCYCDACDEDSADMVDQTQRYVDMVTGGFREYRRRVTRQIGPEGDGPWLEEGLEWSDGAESGSGPGLVGEPFDVSWPPWVPRVPG